MQSAEGDEAEAEAADPTVQEEASDSFEGDDADDDDDDDDDDDSDVR